MSLIKKPAEIKTRRSIIGMIYGVPGIGKSTVGLSAPNPLFFDFDDGIGRVNSKFWQDSVQPKSWQDARDVLDSPESKDYKTYVFDTVGSVLDAMSVTVGMKATYNKQADGSLTLKGFGARKQLFKDFLFEMKRAGKNVIFIAHEDSEKIGDDTQLIPEAGGSSGKDIIKMMDLVGYMQADGNKRVISFSPSTKFKAKNSCELPPVISVPVVTGQDNNFLTDIFEKINIAGDERIEMTKSHLELIQTINKEMESVKDAKTANEFIEYIKTIDHIWDSKLQASKLFSKNCKELKLVYSKEESKYLEPVQSAIEKVKETFSKVKKTMTENWLKKVKADFEKSNPTGDDMDQYNMELGIFRENQEALKQQQTELEENASGIEGKK